MKLKIRRWSKHIIVRFGDYIALKFTMNNLTCPCSPSGWSCRSCDYSQVIVHSGEKYNCTSVKGWLDLSNKEIYKIKKRIKKDLRKK